MLRLSVEPKPFWVPWATKDQSSCREHQEKLSQMKAEKNPTEGKALLEAVAHERAFMHQTCLK